MTMPHAVQTPKGYKLKYTLHGLVLTRAIQTAMREREADIRAAGRPRLMSMFCIAYTKWENIKARLTPIERIQYQRDGYSSVAYDMPTLKELAEFREREALAAIEDGEKFEATGRTLGECGAV